jgi:hypothetical protein
MKYEDVGYPPRDCAPIMQPDDRPASLTHWCEPVGSTVYAPPENCPYCGDNAEDSQEE